jgi:cytochrome b pre-mRNA-processing protein 3
VGLHVGLLIHRLHRDPGKEGVPLAQAVFDAMFSDMDVNLREMGVGDLSVGKKVKAMWNAFHGRAMAYEPAVEARDADALAAALERNIWRREPGGEASAAAAALAAHALAVAASLAEQPLAGLLQGEVAFPPPPGSPNGSSTGSNIRAA